MLRVRKGRGPTSPEFWGISDVKGVERTRFLFRDEQNGVEASLPIALEEPLVSHLSTTKPTIYGLA